MKSKKIIAIILIVFLAIVQLSFIGGLPFFLPKLNLALVVLIFISALSSGKTTLFSVLGVGLLFDLYKFMPFGTNLVALSLAVFSAKFFWDNYFTDRSLYSFLTITFFSSIVYRVLLYVVVFFFSFFDSNIFITPFDWEFFINELYGLGLNLAMVVLIFYLVDAFSSSLKPVFLSKKRWE